jgi:hypothetical protein
LKFTNVSEVLAASIIAPMMEAARTSETLVNFYQITLCYNLEDGHLRTYRYASIITLMMEAARTSETLVNFYQTTWRFNPEESHLRTSQIIRVKVQAGQDWE